jgi:type III pantothenate kinase
VVDIGNSRIKLGVCRDLGVPEPLRTPSNLYRSRLGLIHDDREIGYYSISDERSEWEEIDQELPRNRELKWAICSVNGERSKRFMQWLHDRGDDSIMIDHFSQVPIELNVDAPEKVGLDRLMNAVGAIPHLPSGIPGILIDSGTAITVDLIDSQRVFQGGAILPGFRLMFRSLHEYTAKLPQIDEWELDRPYDEYDDRPPGKNTDNAIVCGVIAAVCGGVERLVRDMSGSLQASPMIIITGGMGREVLSAFPPKSALLFNEKLTLEGIRIAAESLP